MPSSRAYRATFSNPWFKVFPRGRNVTQSGKGGEERGQGHGDFDAGRPEGGRFRVVTRPPPVGRVACRPGHAVVVSRRRAGDPPRGPGQSGEGSFEFLYH